MTRRDETPLTSGNRYGSREEENEDPNDLPSNEGEDDEEYSDEDAELAAMDEEDDGLLGISGNPLTPRITSQIIRYLLQRGGGRTWYLEPGGATDPDDECEEERPTAVGSRRWFPQVTVPSKVGQRLLAGGEFGRLGPYLRSRESSNASLAKRVRDMRTSPGRFVREDLSRDLIPNTSGTIAARYEANPYCGQYSSDSSFYYTCVQDFRLHIYDATHPPSLAVSGDQSEDETTMKETKTINAVPGNWTITDSHLSPDNERMIYSSITTTVHMTRTRDSSNEQIPIPLADEFRRGVRGYVPDFGIYSCRFSADGNEIIAGGSGSIFVYDLQGMRRTVRISAHKEDVNSCCWADTASGNVLISASDDTFLKVWDRRSLEAHANPAGVLVGHTEGITYVSPKGDGRYVVSNGKDQTMRLWDLRKMRSHSEWEEMPERHYGLTHWDYRNGSYNKPRFDSHPQNCSIMAYRGHTVLKTLIRCHFSPAETTGASYLYTGSADGRIHIYSLDGRVVQVLDRSKALPISFDPSEPEPPLTSRGNPRLRVSRYHHARAGVVRDVSWHSQEPVLMSVAWGNGHDGGNVAKHEWKGMGKNGMTLEDVIARQQQESLEAKSGS